MLQIKILHDQGKSIRAIAKTLKLSRNTVRRYLLKIEEGPPQYTSRPVVISKLKRYEDYLRQRQQAALPHWIPATVLYQEISEQGYIGSISLLRQFLRTLKPTVPLAPVIRFETDPGKQMQIDWAEFRRGQQRLSALIATLGYSRMTYVEFVDNQKLETLLQCLINAFEYFGGVTKQLLFDNMKTVVITRNAYGQGYHRFQPMLWDFAKHYGFIPKLCQPYRAQTKGKVERFIGYLRQSFYVPLQATLTPANLWVDVQTANHEVKKWLSQVANKRLHATLHQQPIERFKQEKPYLLALPATPYSSVAKPHSNKTTSKIPLSQLPPCSLSSPNLPVTLQHDLAVYQNLLFPLLGDHHEFTT